MAGSMQTKGIGMKVKLLSGLAGDRVSHAPGEVVDMDPGTSRRMIDAGLAEAVGKMPAQEPAPGQSALPAETTTETAAEQPQENAARRVAPPSGRKSSKRKAKQSN